MSSRTPAPLVPEPEWGTGGLVCPQGRGASCGVGAVPEWGPGWFVCTWAMRRCLSLNGPLRFSTLSQRVLRWGVDEQGAVAVKSTSLWGERVWPCCAGTSLEAAGPGAGGPRPLASGHTVTCSTPTRPLSLPWPLPCLLLYTHPRPLSSPKPDMVLLAPQLATEGLPASACLHFCPLFSSHVAFSQSGHLQGLKFPPPPASPHVHLTSSSLSDVTSSGEPSQSPQARTPTLRSCSLGLAGSPARLAVP